MLKIVKVIIRNGEQVLKLYVPLDDGSEWETCSSQMIKESIRTTDNLGHSAQNSEEATVITS